MLTKVICTVTCKGPNYCGTLDTWRSKASVSTMSFFTGIKGIKHILRQRNLPKFHESYSSRITLDYTHSYWKKARHFQFKQVVFIEQTATTAIISFCNKPCEITHLSTDRLVEKW